MRDEEGMVDRGFACEKRDAAGLSNPAREYTLPAQRSCRDVVHDPWTRR